MADQKKKTQAEKAAAERKKTSSATGTKKIVPKAKMPGFSFEISTIAASFTLEKFGPAQGAIT